MNDELVELLVKYYKENKLVDERFISEVEGIINNNEKIKDAISGIDCSAKEDIAYYAYEDKGIHLNKNLDILRKTKPNPGFNDRGLFENLNIIMIILHELDHAILFNDMYKGKYDLMAKLALVCDIYGDTNNWDTQTTFRELFEYIKETILIPKYYEKYHDYAPYETRAIINSNFETLDLIKELYKTDIDLKDINSLEDYYKSHINSMIGRRYDHFENGISNSRSYDYCNLFSFRKEYFPEELILYNESREKSYIEDSKNYSLRERLSLGLQASEKEINENFDLSKYIEDNHTEIKVGPIVIGATRKSKVLIK